jgi:hypothetical protein
MNYLWSLFHSIDVDINEETVMCVNDGDDVQANYASTMPITRPVVVEVNRWKQRLDKCHLELSCLLEQVRDRDGNIPMDGEMRVRGDLSCENTVIDR